MKEITVQELEQLINSKEPFTLIDVREPAEYNVANLNGVLIPLATVPDNLDKIPTEGKVVVHCRSGKRSADAIAFLESKNYDNLYNLKGGILAWANEIDFSMPKY